MNIDAGTEDFFWREMNEEEEREAKKELLRRADAICRAMAANWSCCVLLAELIACGDVLRLYNCSPIL